MKIAVCSSATFYRQVIALSYELEHQGLEVILPLTAARMRQEGRENEEAKIDWSQAPEGYHGKARLIREHFEEIARADAVLVTNYLKHGLKNYIGPNVLMEMSTAFYLRKPIYVLFDVPTGSPLFDEIMGLEPVFLRGDVSRLIG